MIPVFVAIGVLAFILIIALSMFAKFYHKVEQGYAMIINTLKAEPEVTFTGRLVLPVIHKAELMEISLKTIDLDRTGNDGLICRDNIRADIKVKFFIRVNKTADDVLKVAQSIGCSRASDHETLEGLFQAKFSEALKTVGKSMDFVDLYQARDRFRDEIIRQIGNDLSGYVLEDAAIDYLEQTPIDKLDPNNILDAQGIKKITELTAIENVNTNNLRRDEEMRITKKNVETKEALLELERQQTDAESRQQREIASVRAREAAETAKIQSEEHARAELARLQAEQTIAIQQENVLREKEVAENNRKRAVVIEEQKVIRARELETVDREKEVTLQQIDKEREVEIQKKAIADVVRERIIVERTVAEQEEAIKEVRILSDAERTKKSAIILAEGQAEEKQLAEIKAAEAMEKRAQFKAAEELTLADSRLKVAEKDAEAKKREAEGTEALAAARGLADVKVMLATADAKEKQGLIDAKVTIAGAEASVKQGIAEADSLKAKLSAEAQGNEQLGLAAVNIRLAEAEATAKAGKAEADAIEARFLAEAKGMREKFDAMTTMSDNARSHEEYRMKLETAQTATLKAIDAQTNIAKEQAELLGQALGNAKIDIVGGNGEYFERFVQALSVGKGIDGLVSESQTLKTLFKGNLDGSRDTVEDIKEIIGALGNASGDLQNLSVAALFHKIMQDGSDDERAALSTLLKGFKKLP
ncbi:hypothetical protein [Breznakiella homolactica]|uniref:Membrane protein YqiK n=1 Tax=Breznakiella homolactica TaxID=2798577 RepID=A0A7T7XKW9_9SPIR|nr:hypothetical protein [Breznakiella homolactica]QQO08092.1 hypothetical protein JFL75_14230 [Breznakiella homolactica]